jgi:hypothetical protein
MENIIVTSKSAMKVPEFLVFVKVFVIGLLGAEVYRVAFYLGSNFAPILEKIAISTKTIGVLAGLTLCLIYALQRDAHLLATRIGRSSRIDLLAIAIIGVCSNQLASSWFTKVHTAIKSADPYWTLIIFIFLCVVLVSPLIQSFIARPKKQTSQLHFIEDEEIDNQAHDLLAGDPQAKAFAETILSSSAHSGLVFGLDGPWGIGKTSFLNLAETYWKRAADKVIVCRFEPLRYASEPDLADRLIRDLSAAIQNEVFAPEFRPAASRYSRLIKGKADISFLGFKISLEPSQETVDDLLDDIDEVLRRIGRRLIIVIDDLDRIDSKTVNNVLFATRRTFKLSQATYILCYDTEVLVGNDEGSRAREFLEKFVTVKLSLFVDSSKLRDFLRRDWKQDGTQFGLVPSDTMIKLGAVLNELAEILDSNLAANYLPLVGDLRKVKRFINAMLMMQLEKTNLGRTDFHERDLINLILLHLHYPGVFRRIYAEETEGRSGIFSVRREYGEEEISNDKAFASLEDNVPNLAYFLLKQLFDVKTLNIGDARNIEESIRRSRACFNSNEFRNLEAYLKLIVRCATPEPQKTFALYLSAVEQVRNGTSIDSILKSPDFELTRGEHAQDQFWRILVNESYDFTSTQADDAIATLIEYMPYYSALQRDDAGLRSRSIYSLLRLLDRVGWGRASGRRSPNTHENVVEIAWRIFGEERYKGMSLLERLASPDRGILGWNDLMLFRLQCSADRNGQLYNLSKALIVNQNKDSATDGLVSQLALMEMRKLSQEVFALFKRTYIDSRRNFFAEVNDVAVEKLLGLAFSQKIDEASRDPQSESDDNTIARSVSSTRNVIKSFVIYQLSNSLPPSGSGVGCGYYDEVGSEDKSGIAKAMNDYVFNICFNPETNENNACLFLDHCLSHLTSPFYTGRDEGSYIATKEGLSNGLDANKMGRYWYKHQEYIRGLNLHTSNRKVFMPGYTAFYSEDLDSVFTILDQFSNEFSSPKPEISD